MNQTIASSQKMNSAWASIVLCSLGVNCMDGASSCSVWLGGGAAAVGLSLDGPRHPLSLVDIRERLTHGGRGVS